MKKAQQDWLIWLIILMVSAVLIITLYYAWTGKLALLKPQGL